MKIKTTTDLMIAWKIWDDTKEMFIQKREGQKKVNRYFTSEDRALSFAAPLVEAGLLPSFQVTRHFLAISTV